MATEEIQAPAPVPRFADPAPLGLAGLALTWMLLSGTNAGLIHGGSGAFIFLGMAFFYGGLAQFCAGMWEFANRNTFGALTFSSYGAFWMGLAIMVAFDVLGHLTPATAFFTGEGAIWFLFMWAVFTTYLWIASFRTNVAVWLVLLLLAATYWVLWIGALYGNAPGHGATAWGGYLGLATAAVAWYTSMAGVVNSTFGMTILPVIPLPTMVLARR
jgi:succinate-acetate transporter protein